MNEFKVGDEVEVIMGGIGIADEYVGRKTVITAINGVYFNEYNAVKVKDWVGWKSSRSFKLIKKKVEIIYE